MLKYPEPISNANSNKWLNRRKSTNVEDLRGMSIDQVYNYRLARILDNFDGTFDKLSTIQFAKENKWKHIDSGKLYTPEEIEKIVYRDYYKNLLKLTLFARNEEDQKEITSKIIDTFYVKNNNFSIKYDKLKRNPYALAGYFTEKVFEYKNSGGLIPHFASGGPIFSKHGRVPFRGGKITGVGGPREDRVFAHLPAGSFIVNAKSTKQYAGVLSKVLSGKSIASTVKGSIPAYVSPGETYVPPGITAGNLGTLQAINSGTFGGEGSAVTAAMGGFIPRFAYGAAVDKDTLNWINRGLSAQPERMLSRGVYSKDIEKLLESVKGKVQFIAKNVNGQLVISYEKKLGADITKNQEKMLDQLTAYANKESKYPTQQAKTLDILKKTSNSVLNIAQSVVMFKNGSFIGGISSAITAAIPAIQAAMPEKFGDNTKGGVLLKAGMGLTSGITGIASLFGKQGKKMGSGDKMAVVVSSLMNMFTGLGNAKDAWDILSKKEEEKKKQGIGGIIKDEQSSDKSFTTGNKNLDNILGLNSNNKEEVLNTKNGKKMKNLAENAINNPEALSKIAMEVYNILVAINTAVQQIRDKVARRTPQSNTELGSTTLPSTSASDFNLEGDEGTDLIGNASEQTASEVEKMGNEIKKGTSFFSGLWDKAKGFFDNFMSGFSNIWSSISNIFGGLFSNKQGIGGDISTPITNGIGGSISTPISENNEVYKGIGSTSQVLTAGQSANEESKGGGIFSWLTGLLGKGKDLIGGFFGNIFGNNSETTSKGLGNVSGVLEEMNSKEGGALGGDLTKALTENTKGLTENTKGIGNVGKLLGGGGGPSGGPSAGGGASFGSMMGALSAGIGFGSTLYSLVSGFFAEGGPVSGPGTGTSDSIPAMLSNGEFVMSAEATKNNKAVLSAINNGADFRDIFEAAAINAHYAEGGFVGPATIDTTAPAITASTSDLKPNPIAENGISNSHQEFSIAVTGDVSAQTSREIRRMIPEIAAGVRQHGRVKGWTW